MGCGHPDNVRAPPGRNRILAHPDACDRGRPRNLHAAGDSVSGTPAESHLVPTRDEAIACVRASPVARFAESILEALAPSVLLRRDPAGGDAPVGVSRLGGDPDLPAGFAWPSRVIETKKGILRRRVERRTESLDFLMQIRCDELPGSAVPAGFPRTGMLWVFYAAVNQPWNLSPAEAHAAQLVHLAAPGPLVRTPAPHADQRPGFRPCRIRPTASWTLPEEVIPMDTDDEGLVEAYLEEVCVPINGDPSGVCHRMFGHAQWIQGDATLREPPRPPRRLLLQIDSDDGRDGPGWMWGDGGRIYFYMTDQELAEGRFTEAQWTVQCY